MTQKKPRDSDGPRHLWRTYGYLAAILLFGIAIGLLLYPILLFPAVWTWAILGLGILLLALSAPLLRK